MEYMDIRADEVAEWLLTRGKLPKDWGSRLRALETEYNLNEASLKESRYSNLLSTGLSTYLKAKETFENLLNTEEPNLGKTLLGYFKSEILYAWERNHRLYQKSNLHLGELAKTLSQISLFEIPSLKSQISALEKSSIEIQHKQASSNENIQKKSLALESYLASLGIKGFNPELEIRALTRKLPILYNNLLCLLRSEKFSEMLNFYIEVTIKNHEVSPELPTIEELKAFNKEIDFIGLEDHYAPEAIEVLEVQIEEIAMESDWGIETIEQGEVKEQEDYPLASRMIRGNLINELVELKAFTETNEQYEAIITEALDLMKEIQELVLLHEQPEAVRRILNKINAFDSSSQKEQVLSLEKSFRDTKLQAEEMREQSREILKQAEVIISLLEQGIQQIFPSVSIKIVGEIIKDIRISFNN